MKLAKQSKKFRKKERILNRYAIWRNDKREWRHFYHSYFADGDKGKLSFCGMCN